MEWINEQLVRIIQHRSRDLNFLQSPKPQQPENNPLIEERIGIRSVKLRLKLEKIRETDSSKLVSDIADSIELSSEIRPLSRDHEFTEYQIEEYLNYHTSLENWKTENSKIESTVLGRNDIDLEPFTMVINTRKNIPILMFSGNDNCRSIGLNELDNIIGDHIAQYSNNFACMSEEQISEALEGIDFNSLRKRLINAGYVDIVSLIDKEVVRYF